jgi:hypothetical protein
LKEKILPLPGIEPLQTSPQLVAILNELSWLYAESFAGILQDKILFY